MTQADIDFANPTHGMAIRPGAKVVMLNTQGPTTTYTSRAAFESIKPHKARLMTHVYMQIQRGPATCDELEVALGMSHQCCSARVNNLMKVGLIVNSGERRKTRSGRPAIVWRAK